jgi:hypothetical protein
MQSRKLDRILEGLHTLEELHTRETTMNTDHEQRLEAELLSRHERLYPHQEGWKMLFDPRVKAGRLVLTLVAVVALGIAACTVPTEYEADVGKTLDIHVAGSAKALPSPNEMVALLDQADVADQVSVSISESPAGEADLHLMLWGQNVSSDRVIDLLRTQVPALAEALFSVDELQGTVRSSLAEKIGHDVFKIEVSGDTAEEIRQQILTQMAAQGIQGDAVVEIHEEGDQQRVEIQVESEEQ